jgi:hypothetical protein
MSTKTTFKRIALVTVAALGFGGLVTVAPANAAATLAASLSAGTVSPSRVGIATSSAITLTTGAMTANAVDTTTVSVKVTSAPAGSAFSTNQVSGTAGFVTGVQATGTSNPARIAIARGADTPVNGTATETTTDAVSATDSNTVFAIMTETATAAGAMSFGVVVSVTPDVAGTYTVLVSTGLGSAYAPGDTATTFTFTTAGAPASIVLTPISSSTTDSGTAGTLIRVSVRDAAGNATTIAANEALTYSASAGSVGKTDSSSTSGIVAGSDTGAARALGTADFYNTGAAMLRVWSAGVTADTSAVITVSGSGLIPATVTTNTTISILDSTAPAGTLALTSTTGYQANGSNWDANPTRASHSLTLTLSAAASATAITTYGITVTDTNGSITGDSGLIYNVPVSVAAAATTGARSIAVALANGRAITVAAGNSFNIVGETAAIDTVAATLSNVVATAASTTALSARVRDQFGNGLANQTVLVSVTGRNATTSSVSRASDANGFVSFDLVDAATTGTSSVVTFAITGGTTNSATSTVIFGTPAVSTVSLTGGNTTAGVTAATVTVRDIFANGVTAGAEGATYAFSATVRDAAGNALAGVPVTWTVSGAGAAIPSTSRVTFTSALGVASTSVYGWIAGTYTVTGTAGTVAGTGTITFGQTAAGEERTISATVSGPIVTAKVVDRFGNPVPAVTVYATEVGTGYFGTGVTSTSGVTNAAGIVEFVLIGDGEVTVSTINPASVAGAFGSGQTSAPKGYAANATTAAGLAAQILLASTTGTSLVAEEGVGASFDAAGVASAKVTVTGDNSAQAAADAAAEATDAANAATDAANAAAEAADAATAAAQDAADAVAALATSVEAMVGALKKQITALTNLVIKIQKKVRA